MKKNPPPIPSTQNLKEKKSKHLECMFQPTHWMHVFFISKIFGHHFWLKLMVGGSD
jgi:hypothetical protein